MRGEALRSPFFVSNNNFQIMDCLNGIVGISKSANCLPNDIDTTSISGLYLDDTSKGRIPLKQAFWANLEIVKDVIPDATLEVERLVRIALSNSSSIYRRFKQINGPIGFKNNYTGVITEAGSGWRYIVYRPKTIQGSQITISNVEIHLQSGLYSGEYKLFKGSTEIDLDATPLPYTTTFNENIYIAYQDEYKPLNFKHSACCGSYAMYDGYAYVGSGEVASTSLLEFKNNNYAQGIYADVSFDCDELSFLCKVDFTRAKFPIVFAKLIQQVARRNVLNFILTSDNITPYAMVKADELATIAEYLDNDISTMLGWMPENYDYSDCFICNGQYKGDILI